MAIGEQTITINLIPGTINPVIHVSQYDVGRQINLNVVNGITPYTFADGDTVILNGKKPDNTVFSYTTTVSGNTVSFETTEQMLALKGVVTCEIRIYESDSVNVGSANFAIVVESAPIAADAVYSETEIPIIVQAIDSAGIAIDAAATATNAATSATESKNQAVQSATSASQSAASALADKNAAKNSADAAAISEANAFSGTPEGYAELASTFNALGLYVDDSGYTCQALFGETKD